MIRDDLEEIMHPYLRDGEILLWCGKPKRGLMFRGVDIYLVPVSVLYMTVFSLIFISLLQSGTLISFVITGCFLAFGVQLFVGRFILDFIRRRRSVYCLTNRRVMTLMRAPLKRLESQSLRTLSAYQVKRGFNGRGTIILGRSGFLDGFMGAQFGIVIGAPRLEGIENVKDVAALLFAAQNRHENSR